MDRDAANRILAETIAWCRLSGPTSHGLRSPELRPERLFLQKPPADDVDVLEGNQRFEIVDTVTRHRARALSALGWPWDDERAEPEGGQLLLFRHDVSLCDGAAREQSDGFFDDCNEPPWDTWLWYEDNTREAPNDPHASFLVSWVPQPLVAIADRGVVINYEECLAWANRDSGPWGAAVLRRCSLPLANIR